MGGKYSVKNLKEVMTLAKVVAVVLIKEVKKDGFQLSDFGAFMKSPEFEAALQPALADLSDVALEVAELDFSDGVDLAKHAYSCADDMLDAVRA